MYGKKLALYLALGLGLCGQRNLVLGQYDPPPGYYSSATGVGPVLEEQLHDIIDGHVVRSYDAARVALQILDRDPNDPTRIILVYTGASVPGTWDLGITWNREHQWPRSLGVGDSGPDNSDLFQLKPCNPNVNTSRGNDPYGIGSGYWDPAALALPPVNHRGDCSRSIFYLAVRYDGSDAATTDLTIVNGQPGTNQMGDLARMLEWHYADPVDEGERLRNHLIWSSADNPQYYQGNRNPFIDHPEFVWAVWGPSPNDSSLYVGQSPLADGSSAATVDMLAIVGGTPDPVQLPLNKTGTNPTTYDVFVSGDVSVSAEGQGQTFVGGIQSLPMLIAVPSTTVPGETVSTVTIDNTDLTSAGTGQGMADQDDVVTVSAVFLDHSNASFAGQSDSNELTLDFGSLSAGSGPFVLDFDVHNLEAAPEFTADLDIVAITPAGDDDVLFSDLTPTEAVPAGSSVAFQAFFDTNAGPGAYQATYTISVADEDLPGGIPGTTLTLNLMGEIVAATPVPTTSTWGVLVLGLLVLTSGTLATVKLRSGNS